MTPKTSPEPTNSQILEAVQSLSGSVDKRFAATDSRSDEILEAIQMYSTSVDSQLHDIHTELHDVRVTMVTKDHLEKRLRQMQVHMVTKDYLDTKLANLEGNLIVLTRKEDQKLHTLVDILHDKQVINDADVRRVERLEPFAR